MGGSKREAGAVRGNGGELPAAGQQTGEVIAKSRAVSNQRSVEVMAQVGSAIAALSCQIVGVADQAAVGQLTQEFAKINAVRVGVVSQQGEVFLHAVPGGQEQGMVNRAPFIGS